MSDEKKKLPEDPAGTPGADPAGEQTPIEEKAPEEPAFVTMAPSEEALKAFKKFRETTEKINTAGKIAQQIGDTLAKGLLFDEALKRGAANMAKAAENAKIKIEVNQDILKAALAKFRQLARELEELTPYIEAELEKPEYGGMSIEELFDIEDEISTDRKEIFEKVMDAARAARESGSILTPAAPKATPKKAEIIEYPLDKPNSEIWEAIKYDTGGQLKFAFDTAARKGRKQEVYILCSINFDDLGDDVRITKKLTAFDKRVYIAVAALYNAGNRIFTVTQIYYAMGGIGTPSTDDLKKISDAITKMNAARITIDNKREAELYNYPRFPYDNNSLLPMERISAIVNGRFTDAAIHPFREPPLISFAKGRNQITQINVKLLQSPISKTEANLQLEDYLLERIARAKNEKKNSTHKFRILYKTLYERAGMRTAKQKQRAPKKAERYLAYYTEQGYIKRHTFEEDGITIYW